jgi:UDP:flavonoid glycosyltransferase YjiC (YdhE family)
MRILFTFIGGSGHFYPLVPVARAAQSAGHTVAVAGSGNMVPTIQAAGFTAFATSEPRPRSLPPRGAPLEPVDPQHDDQVLRDNFAGRGARRHAGVLPGIIGRWAPDVLVRDEVDFGTAVAAELLGIPCASVVVLAAGTFLRKDLVAEPLHELRSDLSMPPDPTLAMLDRDLVLSPFPPSFRSPDSPLPPKAFSFRQAAASAPSTASPTPTVYFTLGTVYTDPELHVRVLAGLREVPANVIMTVGEYIDPAEFGPQPSHIRIENFVPQGDVLPHCDLVVSHGGSGSLIGTLAHGLPSILLPLGADQPHNAKRCVELGLGQVLDAVTATPQEVRDAVVTILADPAYRRAAQRIQQDINALPAVAKTVPLIEELAAAVAP